MPVDLPAAVEVEASVLGCILLDNSCWEMTETLSTDHFYHFAHRKIYGAMVEMHEAGLPIDYCTLSEFMQSRNSLESIGGRVFLFDLTRIIVLQQSLPTYIKILNDKKQLRDIIAAGKRMVQRAMSQEDKPNDILAEVEKATTKVASDIQVKDQQIFLNVEQFTNRYNTEIEWRVDGAIEVGTNGILVGASGDGKSPVARALAVCLASGIDWLDLRVKRARTALISREDYPGTTSRFIRRFIAGTGVMADEIGLKHWLYIHSREQKKSLFLDDPADLRLLINNLKSRQIEFAVFDVWNKFHRADENDNTQMRGILNRVEQVRDEVGCQVLVLHHTNKMGGSRGASALDGFAEANWRLSVEEGEGDDALRKMTFVRVKAGFANKPIYFKIVNQVNGGVTLERQPIEEKQVEKKFAQRAR